MTKPRFQEEAYASIVLLMANDDEIIAHLAVIQKKYLKKTSNYDTIVWLTASYCNSV